MVNKRQSSEKKTILDDLLFARQPIFDHNKKLYAFELLYRDKDPNAAFIDDADQATSSVIVNYCGSIIDEEESPCEKVFINLTRKLLLSDYFFPLEPHKIVIEILEDVTVDQTFTNRIIELKAKGYQFALDDYEFSDNFDPLLPLVSYIKVELLNLSIEQLKEKMEQFENEKLCKLKNRPILLAEKVEDQATYDACQELGFELFQGYFLERPIPIYGKKVENNSETALRLVSKLQNPDVEVNELSRLISVDVRLSYQILKIVNSPLCRMPRPVQNLNEAVVFLGIEQIKKWAVAMALSGSSAQSKELLRILLIRARACELIAIYLKVENPESFFTVGLFSGIDAVMLADKKWLIDKLDLTQDINEALLEYKGNKGIVLQRIISLEHGEFSFADELDEEIKLSYYQAHETAVKWANQLFLMI